ncbi:hypothetical protein V8C44DRAFT_323631 [Trichoderma aethiopicum]
MGVVFACRLLIQCVLLPEGMQAQLQPNQSKSLRMRLEECCQHENMWFDSKAAVPGQRGRAVCASHRFFSSS